MGLQALVVLAAVLTAVAGLTKWPTFNAPHTVPSRIYTTTIGQRAHVTLADGSTVLLAPLSRLEVAADYSHGSRTVQLEGQAYFTVHASASDAFSVRTGGVSTRVLGTTFDIRHYAGDPTVRVAVTDGKVAVASRHQTLMLSAGAVAHATDSTAVLTRGAETATNATAWTDGQLVFQEVPVRTVLEGLGRWYGYEFRLADTALANRPVTVTFDVADSPGMLVLLRHLLGVAMTFDGPIVTLAPRRSGAGRAMFPRSPAYDPSSTPTQVGR
jgi:transmembrane sensor